MKTNRHYRSREVTFLLHNNTNKFASDIRWHIYLHFIHLCYINFSAECNFRSLTCFEMQTPVFFVIAWLCQVTRQMRWWKCKIFLLRPGVMENWWHRDKSRNVFYKTYLSDSMNLQKCRLVDFFRLSHSSPAQISLLVREEVLHFRDNFHSEWILVADDGNQIISRMSTTGGQKMTGWEKNPTASRQR